MDIYEPTETINLLYYFYPFKPFTDNTLALINVIFSLIQMNLKQLNRV